MGGSAKIYSVPDAPRYLNSVPTITNTNQIGIIWEDGESTGGYSIKNYSVEWALEKDDFTLFKTTTDKKVTKTDLTDGKAYKFRVQSENEAGKS